MLIDRLGEREVERRRIRCGNAYHFQGDERHIMFVSLVVAAGDDRRARGADQGGGPAGINVAASRAQDQMWCVRSISADELHPDDVRGRFIHYCQNPALVDEAIAEVEGRFDSDFERDVYRHLIARGYRVKVEHRVGRFRIDLVVEGRRGRLAVELDGDAYHGPDRWEADRNRQSILERLGWTFHRIRGSAYYRDPDAALAGCGTVWKRSASAPPASRSRRYPQKPPTRNRRMSSTMTPDIRPRHQLLGPQALSLPLTTLRNRWRNLSAGPPTSHCAKDPWFPGVTTPLRRGQSTPGFPPWLSTGAGRLIRFPTCTPRLSGASSKELSISSPAKVRS